MASLALARRKRDQEIGYTFRVATPRTDIGEPWKAFLTYALAGAFVEYQNEIIRFGREWSADSFPFRELAFALVSIASGEVKFHSFPAQHCNPRNCQWWDCRSNHLPNSPGWLDTMWAGDSAPLPEFGSMSHRPGDPPGASPTETMYWIKDVLVSLTVLVDGAAITNAVAWGVKQGRTNFQMVVLSLFKVVFAVARCGSKALR